jgi:hypothetical protein
VRHVTLTEEAPELIEGLIAGRSPDDPLRRRDDGRAWKRAEQLRPMREVCEAEHAPLPGISIYELVFGVPYYRIVNAAFCHAHPLGSRFNPPDRGTWYAAFELDTAQAEVAYHKWRELLEVNWLEEEVTYDEYLADFSAEFHDIRGGGFLICLDPESYVASQELAEQLLEAGSLGVVYPSVRKPEGTCLACFRPALVTNVRQGRCSGGRASQSLWSPRALRQRSIGQSH